MIKDFTEMSVWKLSMEVAVETFHLSEGRPRKEDYGLTSQIRRSSNSISANIAEAFGRTSSADKRKFYDYSRGSAFETRSHLIYGNKVGYFDTIAVQTISDKISSIIHELNTVKLSLSK